MNNFTKILNQKENITYYYKKRNLVENILLPHLFPFLSLYSQRWQVSRFKVTLLTSANYSCTAVHGLYLTF